MPIPVVAAAAVGVVGSVTAAITAVITFFAARMSAKVALIIIAVGMIAGLTIGLIAALNLLAASISGALPSNILPFIGALLPTNLNACISVIVSASVLRWVYDREVQIVGMMTSG